MTTSRCYSCSKKGHFAKNCRTRRKPVRRQNENNSKVSQSVNGCKTITASFVNSKRCVGKSWKIDENIIVSTMAVAFVATDHAVKNLTCFENVYNMAEACLKVADGSKALVTHKENVLVVVTD